LYSEKKLIEFYDLSKDPIKHYFQEKVQSMAIAMNKPPQKLAAELYFDKFARLNNQLNEDQSRQADHLLNSAKMKLPDNRVTVPIAENQGRKSKLLQQHDFKINIMLDKDHSETIRTAIEVYSKSNNRNSEVVKGQLDSQDTTIKNRIFERKIQSISRSKTLQSQSMRDSLLGSKFLISYNNIGRTSSINSSESILTEIKNLDGVPITAPKKENPDQS